MGVYCSAEKRCNSDISHHGILGMKCGIRRTDKQLGHYSGHTIKAGTEFNRLTTNPNEKESGVTFVSYTKRDNNFYNGILASDYKRKTGKDLYSQKMKSVKDIVTPSYEKQVDTFVSLYKNNTVSMAKEFSREHNDNKDYSKLTDKEVKKEFNSFITNASGDNKTKIHSQYFKSLAKQGYNAIPDWHDKIDNDNGLLLYDKTDEPLIIFDRKKTLINTANKKLTSKSMKESSLKYEQSVLKVNKSKRR